LDRASGRVVTILGYPTDKLALLAGSSTSGCPCEDVSTHPKQRETIY
jgi:hypothetical protein